MWNLNTARDVLSDRLGEDSTVFWSDTQRVRYLNEAQRLIASITRGITSTVTQNVSSSTPAITLPAKTISGSATNAYVTGGRILKIVTVEEASIINPRWRALVGSPLWVVLDLPTATATVTPTPTSAKEVNLVVAILPSDVSDDSDELFNGVDVMEQYQGALINFAASLALLKERYDGDAERFYQYAVQEMQSVGTNPQEIPPFRTLQQESR